MHDPGGTNEFDRPLEPDLAELERRLEGSLRGPQPPADLAERVFDATADHVLAGDLAESLHHTLPTAAPRGLADRVHAATTAQPTVPPTHGDKADGVLGWITPRSLAGFGGLAAALVMMAMGLAIYFGGEPADPPPLAGGPNATADPADDATTAEVDQLDPDLESIEWTVLAREDDDIRREVTALAADVAGFNYRTMDREVSIDDEISRHVLFYELAEAPPPGP